MRLLAVLAFILQALCVKGQWDPAGGEAGSFGVHRQDIRLARWADSAVVLRGWRDISKKDSGYVSGGDVSNIYGSPDNYTLSLGDSGSVIIFLKEPVKNIDGFDFVVFENGFAWFSGYFLELAFVEVSTDGSKFVRFPAQTIADTLKQYTNNAAMDPSQYFNLAGKHQAPYGTPFDLEQLSDSNGIDTDSIHFIRLIDVVGTIDPQMGARDINGRIINDPWPTAFDIGGFDLDAVGVLSELTTKTSNAVIETGSLGPNPVLMGQPVFWFGQKPAKSFRIYELSSGKEVLNFQATTASFVIEKAGVYLVEMQLKNKVIRKKLCVLEY